MRVGNQTAAENVSDGYQFLKTNGLCYTLPYLNEHTVRGDFTPCLQMTAVESPSKHLRQALIQESEWWPELPKR